MLVVLWLARRRIRRQAQVGNQSAAGQSDRLDASHDGPVTAAETGTTR
jgi:hypothetical protein